MSTVITREIATKVRDVVDAGLVAGVGQPIPGRMCVEAAVCYALGLPHGDDPQCVAPALRRLKIRLNDAAWSSPMARARGLRRLALAQLGSAGVLDEQEFCRRVVDMTIRRAVPIGLRAAAKVNSRFAERLEAAAQRCEREGTREALSDAHSAANAAYAYAAAYADAAAAAYASASYAASYAAAYAAANADAAAAAYASASYAASYAAANAAAYAAYAAANAANAAYAAYAAGSAAAYAAGSAAYAAGSDVACAQDRVLAEYAEHVVQILIDMNAPGTQWLDLAPFAE